MKCDYCGVEEALPFVCNYCGGTFCPDHRLPEVHNCKGDLSQRPVFHTEMPNFSWQTTTDSNRKQNRRTAIFSEVEIRDVLVAWLALGLAFYIADRGVLSGGLVQGLAVSLITVGSGFVLHELAHKFVAERYGYWAEFRMWPIGVVVALMTSLIGFIFAAPGATYISGASVTEEENGVISIVGPLTNVGVASIFFPLLFFGNATLHIAGLIGFSVNIFLALFNMLPILPLDGAKVFAWNKVYWAGLFIPLGLLFLFFQLL